MRVPFSTHNHVPKLKLILFSYNISIFKNETDSAGVKRWKFICNEPIFDPVIPQKSDQAALSINYTI